MVLGVDEQDSEHHAVLADADDLAGLPVVVADLHSALPAVLAGLRDAAPSLRVAYVMTDGGALPLDFSRTVAGLRSSGWLEASITVGQAFGGDLEAVNVHTGLLAAHHVVGADVVVVSQGPGNLGTGTRWGFSGTSAGEAVNAAGTLGGRPVCSLRISEADPRERHRGVSHHSLTAYGRVSLVPADVPVPLLPGSVGSTGARPGAGAGGHERRSPHAPRGGDRRSRPGAARRRRSRCARWAADTTTTAPDSSARPSRGGMPPGCCSLVADPSGPALGCAQRTSSRSTTKISVSPGLMAAPAPRSP